MQTVLKQTIYIITISIILGIGRFLFIDTKNFNLIKVSKVLKEVEVINLDENQYLIPELMTEPLLASTGFTKYYFSNRQAIIIDARDKEEYEQSHIKYSINIPYNNYEDYFDALEELPLDQIYIIYCNGGECSLSLDLAYVMFDEFDFENIFVYEAGLPEWKKMSYPVVE
tara:strand:- start:494 stop:1003 length:510 start_codon:yes stop_codon:yes gene_type:complete